MLRQLEFSSKYNKYTEKIYKKYQNRKAFIHQMDEDFDFVIDLLREDKAIPK